MHKFFKETIPLRNLFFAVMVLVLASCASIVTPTGGDKDIKPPEVVSTDPPASSVNFTSKKITISFNEYIQLNDLEKQLIVSPIIKPAPVVSAKSKKITIEIDAPLQPNTTYTLNFGNAIVDLRESNPIKDFRYVFSTGSYVDSLQLKGKVTFAHNLKTEGGVLVMLYNSTDDSVPFKSNPDFFTRTDSTGNFIIRNIGKGPYKIFALKDADGDYKFNSADEAVGFLDRTVTGNDSLVANIFLFKETDKKLLVKSSSFDSKAAFTFILNRTPENLELKNLNGTQPWQNVAYNFSKDTITLWMKDTLTDSLSVEISENGKVSDTLRVASIKKPEGKSKTITVTAVKLTVAPVSGTSLLPNNAIQLLSSLPLLSVNESLISLMQDSTIKIPFKLSLTDSIKRTIKIEAETKEKNTYKLQLLPGALKSIYGLNNDSIALAFTTPALTEFGSVKIKLQGLTSEKYLLQLVDDKDGVKYEKSVSKNGNYLFENISPAVYKVRLVKDADGNGRFTTGNYLLKQQPERVYYANESVNIRANWDIEIDWNIPLN